MTDSPSTQDDREEDTNIDAAHRNDDTSEGTRSEGAEAGAPHAGQGNAKKWKWSGKSRVRLWRVLSKGCLFVIAVAILVTGGALSSGVRSYASPEEYENCSLYMSNITASGLPDNEASSLCHESIYIQLSNSDKWRVSSSHVSSLPSKGSTGTTISTSGYGYAVKITPTLVSRRTISATYHVHATHSHSQYFGSPLPTPTVVW